MAEESSLWPELQDYRGAEVWLSNGRVPDFDIVTLDEGSVEVADGNGALALILRLDHGSVPQDIVNR